MNRLHFSLHRNLLLYSISTNSWEQRKLGEVFKYEQPQTYIVENTEYDDKNKIPVLTAGQSFILGYTNEHFGIKEADERNPVIIFDDFTTSSHYVDFPFKVKSSAIKLLTLSTTKDNVYCAYNVLKNISYLPVSHERHWISTFTKFDILLPKSVDEQELIGEYFKLLDNLITLHQRKLDRLKNLKKSMLDKMFPKDGEVVPEIRFKGFTDAWEQRKLGDVADIVGGGTPSTAISEYWDGDIDWYAPAEIADQIFVNSSQKKITAEGLNNSSAKMLPVGTVVFTSRAGIGKTAILTKEGCTNQGFQSIIPHKDELDSYFIFSRTDELKQYGETIGAGSTFVEVSGKQMTNMIISIPTTMVEQRQIGTYFRNLDNLITLHQRKLDKLKNIKKSMLDNMFV